MDSARMEALFDAARRLRPEERRAFLDAECPGDPELRAEVESLLEHLDEDPQFLETPAASGDPELAQQLGKVERVGSYRLIRVLGEGGMGVVFLAEQDSPRREVAIKIVHPAFLSAKAAERLQREGEALGRLQHPAIARVIEVGEAEGPFEVPLTYVAMERLHGEPITSAATRMGLDTRARLDLVAQIADAVQHAHERDVVHRDLKPANVLLSAEGRPQILDFGIARILDGRLEELTISGQALGTPSHMAPEQLRGGADAASPLVDVYALGGLAYELLAGRPPLTPEGRSPAEFIKAVADEDPIPLRRLARNIDADVETIIHKALAREASRRYPSASEFAADLRRYLRNEPIRARPPSAIYLVGRFARRRRAAMIALTAILSVAAVASIVLMLGRSETLDKASQVRGLLRMVEENLNKKDPFAGGELNPAEEASLIDSENWVDAELSQHPQLAAELLVILARIHRNRGDAASGERVSTRALELCRAGPGDQVIEAALARSELGLALYEQRRSAEAEPEFRAALELLASMGNEHWEEALAAKHNLAVCLKDLRRFKAAEALYRECLAERLALLGPDHLATSSTRANLARLLQDSGSDLRRAVELLRESAESDARTKGPEVPYTLVTYSQLAGALTAAGELDEAEEILVEVVDKLVEQLGSDHPDSLASRRNLVKVYAAAGDHETARAILEEMLPDMRSRFGAVDYRSLEIVTRLARACLALEDWPAAAAAWREVETVATGLNHKGHPDSITATLERAQALESAGERAAAGAAIADALERAQAALPTGDPTRTRVESAAEAIGK